MYIIGVPPSSGLAVYVRCLGNWIFVKQNFAVVHSRHNKNRCSVAHCVVILLNAKVICCCSP